MARIALLLAMTHDAALASKTDCGCEAGPSRSDRLAAALLGRLSRTRKVFVSTAVGDTTRAYAVAADELIWQSLRDQHDVPNEVLGAAAGRLIDSYLRTGLSEEALKLYEALDTGARELVVRGPAAFGAADVKSGRMFFIDQTPGVTAAALAAAYVEKGDLAKAETLLQAAESSAAVSDDDRGIHPADGRLAADCIRRLMHGSADIDWFGWVFGEQSDPRSTACPRALETRSYLRMAAKGLAASTLPEGWHTGIEPNERPGFTSSQLDELLAALKSLPAQRDRFRVLKAQLADIDRQDVAWISLQARHEARDQPGQQVAAANSASPEDHALAAALAATLAKPLFNPYQVHDLPPGIVPSKEPAKGTCAPRVIRCLDVPPLRWELLISNDYDPTGEVPAAGYWLRRTDLSAGASRLFYLGIKEHLPFELVPTQAPFIVGDELRLVVRRSAIDPGKVMFPPVGLRFDQDKKPLQLTAKLADIMRDSDGDGLTDLAEQQLLLDLDNPDSDGDGIGDNEDAMPNVAKSQSITPRQSAFAAALAYLTETPDDALSVGVPGSASFVRRTSGDERTLFLVADPVDVAGVSSGHRIIVIPTSLDGALLKKRPGLALLLPMSVSMRLLDETHAEVTYSAGWRGGTLAMERKGSRWRVGTLTAWIT